MSPNLSRVLVPAALLLTLAGCAQTSGESPGPTTSTAISGSSSRSAPDRATTAFPSMQATGQVPPPARTNVRITLRRTGGLAGVDESLVVEPDGSWTANGGRGAKSGKLTNEQLTKVQALAADPKLTEEAKRATTGQKCADAFLYKLDAGSVSIAFADCGNDAPTATAEALATALRDATGF